MILDDSRLDDTALHNGSKDAEVISGLVQARTKVESLGMFGASHFHPFSRNTQMEMMLMLLMQ